MNYSLLDKSGRCINNIIWDGKPGWSPPSGFTLVKNKTLEVDSVYSLNGGQWVCVSQIETPTSEPQWVQFGAILAADTSVNAMVATAAASYPVLHLMLGVGLGQAAQGNTETFAAAWSNAKSMGLVSPELAKHVAEVGLSLNLPQAFLTTFNS